MTARSTSVDRSGSTAVSFMLAAVAAAMMLSGSSAGGEQGKVTLLKSTPAAAEERVFWPELTIVLHGAGYRISKGERETGALIERLCDEEWAAGIADNLNTVPARTAGQKRLKAYCAFCRQADREYAGDDLGEPRKRYTELYADASTDGEAERHRNPPDNQM